MNNMAKGILFGLITYALLTGILVGIVYADTWEYKFPITCADNSSTSRTYYPVMLGFNGQTIIDSGKIDADGLNTNMMLGASGIKYMISTENVTAVLPTLPNNGQVTAEFYTGYSPDQTNFAIITGDGGYVTRADHADLELGDDFQIDYSGYIDTTDTGENITRKEDAFRTYMSGSGNITSVMLDVSWSNPTGNDDPEGAWSNEANAYDDNLGTYATDAAVAQGAWSEYIEFTTDYDISNARVYYASIHFTQTDMDVYYDGAWHDYFEGATSQGAYEELDGGLILGITKARVRFYNGGAAGAQDIPLAEFDFSKVITATVTDVSSGDMDLEVGAHEGEYSTLVDYGDVLHFNGGATNAVNCGALHNNSSKFWIFLRFELDDDFSVASPTRQDLFHKYVAGTDYIRLQLNDSDGKLYLQQVLGGVSGASLKTVATSWTGGQVYEVLASVSDTAGGIQRLLVDGILVDSGTLGTKNLPNGGNVIIGYYAFDSSMIIHDVVIGTDDLSGAEETDMFDGIFPADSVNIWHLDEGTGLTATDRGTGGNDGTIGGGCSWESGQRYVDYYIDAGGTSAGANMYGISIPDNSNDIIIGSDATPYFDYFKITVAGTLQLHYEPDTMLSGTTVEDLENAFDGVITWGENDEVIITYGAMESYSSSEALAGEIGGFDMPSSTMPSSWFANAENVEDLPFYESFYAVSQQTGQPVQTIYFLAILGFAFGVFFLLTMHTRAALIGVIGFNIVLFIGSSMTIVPMWIPFVTMIVQLGIMYLYRQVAY